MLTQTIHSQPSLSRAQMILFPVNQQQILGLSAKVHRSHDDRTGGTYAAAILSKATLMIGMKAEALRLIW